MEGILLLIQAGWLALPADKATEALGRTVMVAVLLAVMSEKQPGEGVETSEDSLVMVIVALISVVPALARLPVENEPVPAVVTVILAVCPVRL